MLGPRRPRGRARCLADRRLGSPPERFPVMRASWRLTGLLLLAALLAVAAALLLVPPAAAPPANERSAWHALPLVNARTGQAFTLADFAGKTVYVEPMATWCTNCRQQMGTI